MIYLKNTGGQTGESPESVWYIVLDLMAVTLLFYSLKSMFYAIKNRRTTQQVRIMRTMRAA
jgi:hypothetical protein